MTPEAQRIAIAEACGWKWLPCGDTIEWIGEKRYSPPNYLSDLNAMHEVEKTLPKRNELPLSYNIDRYNDYLIDVCISTNEAFCATAAQRAEAFLRTVGKWDDTK